MVLGLLSSMVCIEVSAGSTTCAQFSAIYPVMVVPSVYFIDSTTGVDLEITGGLVTKDSLLASVARARKKLAEPKSSPAPASTSPPVAMLKQVQAKILAQQVSSWLWPHLPIENP